MRRLGWGAGGRHAPRVRLKAAREELCEMLLVICEEPKHLLHKRSLAHPLDTDRLAY